MTKRSSSKTKGMSIEKNPQPLNPHPLVNFGKDVKEEIDN